MKILVQTQTRGEERGNEIEREMNEDVLHE